MECQREFTRAAGECRPYAVRGDDMGKQEELVYLVDDDASVRESLSELLATFGLKVRCFASAAEYLQHRRSDGAGCLLLDVQLPDIDGLELQQRIAALGPPIVFITGHGDIPGTVRAMKAGAVQFLTKPIDTEALLAAVREAHARDRRERAQTASLAVLRRRFGTLTAREREVLALVVSGLRNKQAAWSLGVQVITIKAHRSHVMQKMGARSFAELVRMSGKLDLGLPEQQTGPEAHE
jgi:FixJ family two-component response regulator